MIRPVFAAVLTVVLAFPITSRAAGLDPHLPADTTSYICINVRQILDAPLFKKELLDPARDALKNLKDVNAVLQDLGFDPFKDLDKVIISSPGGTETDRGLIIVHGTFDLAKFKKKGDDAARDNSDVLKIQKTPLGGGRFHSIYQVTVPGKDSSLFVALANNKTLLASPGKDYVVDALKNASIRKSAELKNKDLQALLEKLDGRLSISMGALGKPLAKAAADSEMLPKAVSDALTQVEAVGGGIAITNEVRLDLVVAGKSERGAESIRESLDKAVKLALVGLALIDNKELGTLLEVVKTVRVSGRGKVVAVSATLTADVLRDFLMKDR